jgi:hypothetical protein
MAAEGLRRAAGEGHMRGAEVQQEGGQDVGLMVVEGGEGDVGRGSGRVATIRIQEMSHGTGQVAGSWHCQLCPHLPG